jgi:4'-phosphopantetheinyl transferase
MLQDHLHREIHVWFARPDHATNPARLDQYRAILSTQETTRYRRFHFPADSHRYLIAHALLRKTLSKYADLPPTGWAFTQGTHGRPEISNPGVPALRFNLTHTKGLVGCVVTLENDCGIDAEALSSRHDLSGVAKRMFSVDESRELQQLEGSRQLDYFFARWTLREAYVKALGIGISHPTQKLSFTIGGDDSIQVAFRPELKDNAGHWQFRLLRPTPEHIAAIAIHKNNQPPKKLIVRTVVL